MARLWVSMAGTAGVGKSTLAEALGVVLRRRNVPVDVFGEDELFTRSEFATVADGFRVGRPASPITFEDAYRAWWSSLSDESVAVMDWNPAGMAGDLAWALSHRESLLNHLRTVHDLAGGRVVLLHLLAPGLVTVDRASRQRGEEWVRRFDGIARAAGHGQVRRLDRLVAEARRHAGQTEREVDVATEAGWRIRRVDAVGGPDTVLRLALSEITSFMSPLDRPHA